MTEYEVYLRKKHFNMTDAQARRSPGWHIAMHRRENVLYYPFFEKRDQTGQVIRRRKPWRLRQCEGVA